MGEAKRRGTFEQRKAESILRKKIEDKKAIEHKKLQLIERRSYVKNKPRGKSVLTMASALAIAASGNLL